MKFPARKYGDSREFFDDYFDLYASTASAVNRAALGRAADFLAELFSADRTLYVCGNGGSAAISNHLLCDFSKGIQTDTTLSPRVVSLSTSVEIITAIGNDIEFADVFVYQLRTAARPGDALMTVSSSGNSENVVRAIEWARNHGVRTIAMTGFEGGRSAGIADINLHAPAANYGVVEDIHQSMMHMLAQFIRMSLIDPALIPKRPF
jgi:D-sedoheptulose 7-phosphate isomerase